MTGLSPVYRLAEHYRNPKLVMSSIQPIRDCLAAGCDMEKDILPVIRAKMATKRDIDYWKYFAYPIMQHFDKRTARELAEAQKKPEDVHQRAKKLAAMRRLSPGNFTRFAPELEAYEQKHGRVD